jgi:hypothetical protein
MWKDNIEYIIKRYKRFLKEHGVYKRVLDIHLSSYYCRMYNVHKLDKLLTICCERPEDFLWKADSFCIWEKTGEGESYWWVLSSLWKETCITENIEELNNEYLAARCRALLSNTQNLADPKYYNDSYITKENRETIIQMRKRISKLIYKYEKE